MLFQSRTNNCGELRLCDAGKTVTLAGWLENVREVGANFAFLVLRDYYGTTQVVVETAEMMGIISCPLRSTRARKPTRIPACATVTWICATPQSSLTSSCAARWWLLSELP